MAKVKSINVSFKYTMNMGNYSSMVAQAGAELELEDGDKVENVYEQAWGIVKEQVREQLITKKEGEE